MQIKQIRLLSAVADDSFGLDKYRNLQELLRDLKTLRKEIEVDDRLTQRYTELLSSAQRMQATRESFTIDDGEAPAPKKTARPHAITIPRGADGSAGEHLSVIERYYDRLNFLSNLEVQLQHEFRNDKSHSKALKEIQMLKKDVLSSLSKAHTALSRIAKKTMPRDFETMSNALIAELKTRLADDVSKFTQKTMVSFSRDDTIVFSQYLVLHGLVNDKGYTFSEFYVAISAQIDAKAHMSFYVNADPNFVSPNKMRLQHRISSVREGLNVVEDLFELEDFHSLISDNPVPEGKFNKQSFRAADLIHKVVVGDSNVDIVLVQGTSEQAVQAFIKTTLADLTAILGKAFQGRIKYKQVTTRGRTAVRFAFSPAVSDSVKERSLNRTQLNALKVTLGLSDAQVRKILDVL